MLKPPTVISPAGLIGNTAKVSSRSVRLVIRRMQQTNPTTFEADAAPLARFGVRATARGRIARSAAGARRAGKPGSSFGASLVAATLALVGVACGGPTDHPDIEEVSGTTDYIVSDAGARRGSAPCEHGTVVECKVWITDVDCYTGLAVCDDGQLSGCMDADAAEAAIDELHRAVE